MDWLHEVQDDLEKRVFDEVANLLNLEVDLLFFDTTSTYFELEEADEPVARDDKGRLLTDDRPPAEEDGERRDGGENLEGSHGARSWAADGRGSIPVRSWPPRSHRHR
jgi:hypothetical protein